MTADSLPQSSASSILMVDGDIISRHAIADYLRHCGYVVVEAADITEAYCALNETSLSIDAILFDVVTLGSQHGFELAAWVRNNQPELEVKLVGGFETAAHTAAELCQSGPHLKKPYESDLVVEYIKRLRASRLQ